MVGLAAFMAVTLARRGLGHTPVAAAAAHMALVVAGWRAKTAAVLGEAVAVMSSTALWTSLPRTGILLLQLLSGRGA